MSRFIVRGGQRLSGTVKVHGAKNSVLPIIAASILASEGQSIIRDVPMLDDVVTISKVLQSIGVDISVQPEQEQAIINARYISNCEAPYDLVRQMRASFLVMGPLLARCGEARVALPGGCAIGTRPIDLLRIS